MPSSELWRNIEPLPAPDTGFSHEVYDHVRKVMKGVLANGKHLICLEILDISDFETLAFFKGLDKVGGVQHGIEGAGVQPGETALHDLDL